MKLMPPKVQINMECCSGVVTQAYGQPDNPVLPVGVRITTPYLPPRHFAECHNRKRTVEDTGDTQQREK
ncbi:hypothetical protein ACVCSY_003536 [Escherichia coli]